jgi:hypothetical protein
MLRFFLQFIMSKLEMKPLIKSSVIEAQNSSFSFPLLRLAKSVVCGLFNFNIVGSNPTLKI